MKKLLFLPLLVLTVSGHIVEECGTTLASLKIFKTELVIPACWVA